MVLWGAPSLPTTPYRQVCANVANFECFWPNCWHVELSFVFAWQPPHVTKINKSIWRKIPLMLNVSPFRSKNNCIGSVRNLKCMRRSLIPNSFCQHRYPHLIHNNRHPQCRKLFFQPLNACRFLSPQYVEDTIRAGRGVCSIASSSGLPGWKDMVQ